LIPIIYINIFFLYQISFRYKNCNHIMFIHRFFSAQKPFQTNIFFYNNFYTDPFRISLFTIFFSHRSFCTQRAFTHNHLFHGKALLPLLDYLPFKSFEQILMLFFGLVCVLRRFFSYCLEISIRKLKLVLDYY
jgi:hypothetical protein